MIRSLLAIALFLSTTCALRSQDRVVKTIPRAECSVDKVGSAFEVMPRGTDTGD